MSDTATQTTLSDRYRLDELIGSGGAGEVWRAYDELLARHVAIKVLHPALEDDDATVERFKREAAAAARLTHPNVVVVYDVGRDHGRHYLVMELVEGAPLSDLSRSGPLAPAVVADVGAQVAEALAAAHELGLIHRDIKPANVILSREGVAKVADFGIAKAVGQAQARLTATGTIVGSAAYVAPEQLRDDPVDGRADIYALGLVLHECLTGRRPFDGGTPPQVAARRLREELEAPSQFVDDLPAELDEIIMRATHRDRHQRFASAARFAAVLEALTRPDTRAELGRIVRQHAPDVEPATQVLPRDERYGSAALDADPTDVIEVDPEAVTAPHGRVQDASGRTRGARDGAPRTPTDDPTGSTTSTRVLPAPGSGHEQDTAQDGTDGRSWRAWPLAVAAAVVVVVIGVILATGGSSPPGGDGSEATRPIPIVAAGDHDPFGDREHPQDVPKAYDGDPGTVWNTQRYNSPDLGGLKDGVGIWFDLADAGSSARALRIVLAEAGSDLKVFSGTSQPQGDPNAWGTLVAERSSTPSEVTLEIGSDAAGRYYLIWITRLSGSRTEIGEVTFLRG